jgi:predicted nucleic-acid-binding protein
LEKEKIPAAISTGILGGMVGMAFKGKRGPTPKGKSFLERLSEKMNPLDETEKILEKSRRAMEESDAMKKAIKTHTTTKSDFKYKDALKMTKEKRAAFLAEVTKLAKVSKEKATTYTGLAAGAGAYGGLRAGEAFGKAHTKAVAEDVITGGYKTKLLKEPPMQYAEKIYKRSKRVGAVVGGALGAGAAANYFLRKNI